MCFDLFLNFHCFLAYNIYFGPSEFYICFNWYVDEHQKEIQTWTYCCESIKSRHLYFWLWFLQFLMFISYIIFTTNILWSIKPMTCQDWIFFIDVYYLWDHWRTESMHTACSMNCLKESLMHLVYLLYLSFLHKRLLMILIFSFFLINAYGSKFSRFFFVSWGCIVYFTSHLLYHYMFIKW